MLGQWTPLWSHRMRMSHTIRKLLRVMTEAKARQGVEEEEPFHVALRLLYFDEETDAPRI